MGGAGYFLLAARPGANGDPWPIVLVAVLGGAAIYLLLPRPKPYPTLWGATLGTLALVAAGVLLVNTGSASIESILFYAFSAMAIISGTFLVTLHNPARAALSFALVILSTCGLFLLLAAPFLMAATIIIYAGAIVVTFLFVLMLAQQSGLSDADIRSREPLFSAVAGFAFLGAVLFVLQAHYGTQTLDRILRRIEAARTKNTAAEIVDIVGKDEKLFTDFELELNKHRLDDLLAQAAGAEVRARWNKDVSVEEMQTVLENLANIGTQARAQLGIYMVQPHGDHPEKMSSLSGPPPNIPPSQLRRDPITGIPQLPAENAAYLGRSLFTDYLLPVELGGLLLLVAVVGAIAIARRAPTQEKPL